MTVVRYDLNSMSISELICLYAIGAVGGGQIIKVSQRMVELGADSGYLFDLMFSEDLTTEEMTGLFEKAVDSLGYQLPGQNDAALTLSAKVAREILSGEKDPYDGAMFIWKNILDNIDEIPDLLWPFKSNASAIEDTLSHIENYVDSGRACQYDSLLRTCNQEIVESAQQLTKQSFSDS